MRLFGSARSVDWSKDARKRAISVRDRVADLWSLDMASPRGARILQYFLGGRAVIGVAVALSKYKALPPPVTFQPDSPVGQAHRGL